MILHKNKLDQYKIQSNQPLIKWSFDPDSVFERLNAYLVRLHDVNEIIVAANDFLKLEKIEIGGIKGRHLNERIHSIHNEFHTLYSSCITNHSNLLEPSNKQFKLLKRNFHAKIIMLERKLSQIFMETFSNCNSTESSIKTIEMFGSLLERNIIKVQISSHIDGVIKSVRNEMNDVNTILTNSSTHCKQIRVNECIVKLNCAWLIHSTFFSNELQFFDNNSILSFFFLHIN